MKFTSKDLMKAMSLQVGDRVKVTLMNNTTKIYEVIEYINSFNEKAICLTENKNIAYLLNIDYEILPRPKRVGDLKCDEKCNSCPIKIVCNIGTYNDDWSLYEVLKDTQVENCDQEIYDLLKARLDKEVE